MNKYDEHNNLKYGSRLDYIFTSQSIMNETTEARIEGKPLDILDHNPVTIKFNEVNKPKARNSRHINPNLLDIQYLDLYAKVSVMKTVIQNSNPLHPYRQEIFLMNRILDMMPYVLDVMYQYWMTGCTNQGLWILIRHQWEGIWCILARHRNERIFDSIYFDQDINIILSITISNLKVDLGEYHKIFSRAKRRFIDNLKERYEALVCNEEYTLAYEVELEIARYYEERNRTHLKKENFTISQRDFVYLYVFLSMC